MKLLHPAWRMRAAGALLIVLSGLAASSPCCAAETYLGAVVDTAGDLRIERAKGRAVVLRKDGEQVGFDKLAISKDGRSVGWLALYPNCCTSYPIPLKLRVCSRGHVRTFEGDLPIWRWKFTGDGRQVSFEQETVHGGLGIHYELREVATGRLIAQYDPPPGTEGQPPPSQDAPPWVAELDANP